MSFPYKCILLIGATSGIGLAMAEKLVRSGSRVIVVGRRQDRLDAFVSKHGKDNAGAIPFDINNTAGLPQFVETVTSTYPELDCVFLNAGIQRVYDLSQPATLDLAGFHAEIAVNFTSFVNFTNAFLPFLQGKEDSSIIYTNSHLSLVPATTLPAYSASKAALNAYILCLREQLTHSGSSVAIIELSPPPVQTELHDVTMGADAGRAFGMPLDAFTEQAYAGMVSGKDEVYVGALGAGKGDPEMFLEVAEKRRGLFERLAKMMRSH